MKIAGKLKYNLILLTATFLFGFSFLAMKIASEAGMSAEAILFFRGAISLVFAVVFFFRALRGISKREWLIGLLAGLLNIAGYYFQILGIQHTTPANNAFISGLNAVVAPVAAWIIYRARMSKRVWVALPVSVVGAALLSGVFSSVFQLNWGDFYSLICALIFGVLIAYLSHTAAKVDFRRIAFIMVLVQTVGGGAMYALRGLSIPTGADLMPALLSMLYLGIVCSFLASVMQIASQRHLSAASSALIMTLEGVFAGILSVVLAFEPYTWQLLAGGLLITAATLFSQWPLRARTKNTLPLAGVEGAVSVSASDADSK